MQSVRDVLKQRKEPIVNEIISNVNRKESYPIQLSNQIALFYES